MDIKLEQKKKRKIKAQWFIPVIGLALYFVLKPLFGDASYVVDTKTLRTATVKQDKFEVLVRSNGELRPKEFQRISAQVSGVVDRVMVDAGDTVQAGQVLVQLSNPLLMREMEQAELEYQQAKSEAFASQKSQESEFLALQSEALLAELAYQSNMLKLDAERDLIANHPGIVSQIDHQRTIFSVDEQKQIMGVFKKRIAKMKEIMNARRDADSARISNLKNALDHAEQQVERLQVRARTKGVVQGMDLEPGQELGIGTLVARVADDSQLIAELQVQELQVQSVRQGQPVMIDTRQNQIRGEVTRIHPSVTNGMVQVDVKLLDELPPEARIALSIEGSITTLSFDRATFVQRPAHVQPNAVVGIYKISQDNKQAQRIQVEVGQSSVKFIQVLEGLNEGDEIIVSDTSSYAEHQTVYLN
ncbi:MULTISPECIES: efflux RND transporter periplasmic adaptor subunit [Pseudoalteromonas]|uniref:CusB-like barrel-sandwich hybrid domain-containing protein n=1 Tax=Pseudoalteromonas amylolytica TaxID=1859457 RepID=A0A1S1MZK2_9GAMM|nr:MULTISPECIES: HlyD family efflux transporter periplasmic adaptor subunit [Pseudoalteromonas]OHU90797.1 hypothetical protein BFC16_04145 [Pseudoalteromonas sp. JW3]OHU92583.1 hypothetical protein BET10_03745 [Pseudoalteromonas amylolytica]